jgi:hypothetical protein
MTERKMIARVWCDNYRDCGTIGDPGFTGGDVEDLCYSCEQKRLAGQAPPLVADEQLALTAEELASIPL